MVSLQYNNSNVGRELAEQITSLLQQQVPKIKTIDQRKIVQMDRREHLGAVRPRSARRLAPTWSWAWTWSDSASTRDKRFIRARRTPRSESTTAKRTARWSSRRTYRSRSIRRTRAIPTSERTEPAFRREFVAVLADQIARYFYAHDPYADMAQDAAALR